MYLTKALPKSMIAIWMLTLFISACSHSSSNVITPLPNAEFPVADLNKTVARVNGKDISAAEHKRAQKILIENKPGLQIPATLQKEFEMQALNQLISSELLFQASQKLDIKDLDKQAEVKLAQTKNRFPDVNDYAKGLQDIGMDEKMFLDSVRRDLAISYLVNTKIASDITVSQEEIQKFYDHNPEKFRLEEQVRASHLLIGVDSKAGPEEKKAARDKADRLHRDLLNGGDFAKLAKETSTCPSSKQGGDLGFFSRGKMDTQFEKAAFALEAGGLSDVVETRYGYHIIKMVERKKAEQIPLSTASKKIEDYLRAQKTNAAVEVFVGEARKNAKIDMLL